MTEEEYGWHRQLAHARRDAFVRGYVRFATDHRDTIARRALLEVYENEARQIARMTYKDPERPKPDPRECLHARVWVSRCMGKGGKDTVYCEDCGISIGFPSAT